MSNTANIPLTQRIFSSLTWSLLFPGSGIPDQKQFWQHDIAAEFRHIRVHRSVKSGRDRSQRGLKGSGMAPIPNERRDPSSAGRGGGEGLLEGVTPVTTDKHH